MPEILHPGVGGRRVSSSHPCPFFELVTSLDYVRLCSTPNVYLLSTRWTENTALMDRWLHLNVSSNRSILVSQPLLSCVPRDVGLSVKRDGVFSPVFMCMCVCAHAFVNAHVCRCACKYVCVCTWRMSMAIRCLPPSLSSLFTEPELTVSERQLSLGHPVSTFVCQGHRQDHEQVTNAFWDFTCVLGVHSKSSHLSGKHFTH